MNHGMHVIHSSGDRGETEIFAVLRHLDAGRLSEVMVVSTSLTKSVEGSLVSHLNVSPRLLR
jgi:hypothetical protein